VEVTLHKLFRQVQRHDAAKRAVSRDQPLSEPSAAFISREPSPDEAVAAADELECLLTQLPELGRQALELRLQGYEQEEIAGRLGCSQRSVGRWLSEARRLLIKRGGTSFVIHAARAAASSTKQAPAPAHAPPLQGLEFRYAWSEFVLQEQIGQGATGRVYRAIHKPTGNLVAIKFLRKSLHENRSIIERFLRESAIVQQLTHPGIVPIHGMGRAARRGLFLVMEYVRGRDLDHRSRSTQVSARAAASWVLEAARIIHFANQHGVIHCDLKPGNLLLDDSGQIRVTDFGFALANTGLPVARLAGTPAFMAPEQIDSSWGPISARTDVWGLGSVLFFLLTGHPPHRGSTLSDVLSHATSAAAVPIPPLHASHSGLAEILRRCLVKQPIKRFASALELSEALHSIPDSSRSSLGSH
jgi:eukaryotic-like serine/threonine-protein kinase